MIINSLDFDKMIPDPDETWSDFFKRLLNFKLYKPPMVHKDSIPLEKKTSFYMKVQTKLLEIEYDKTSKYNY